MLFRPSPDQNLDAVQAMLAAWNAEADRFRQAAIAARRGEVANALTISAAEEVLLDLNFLLAGLDDALAKGGAGSQQFAALLRAQSTTIALSESVGTSLDILSGSASEPVSPPVRIAHESRDAAE